MTVLGVVLDASALVVYAQNDLRALPVDELLRELREDTGGPVAVPGLAYADAALIVGEDKVSADRLRSLADAHGIREPEPDVQRVIDMIVSHSGVSQGLAHAMVLSARSDWQLATYVAPTLRQAGFEPRLILDLDELFRSG